MPSGLVGAGLATFGTEEQKQRWLAPLAQGIQFGAAGVTEPRSGSDVAGMTTNRCQGLLGLGRGSHDVYEVMLMAVRPQVPS